MDPTAICPNFGMCLSLSLSLCSFSIISRLNFGIFLSLSLCIFDNLLRSTCAWCVSSKNSLVCCLWARGNIRKTECCLASEYQYRYNKIHSCAPALFEAKKIFHRKTEEAITVFSMAENFSRAMPNEWKYDDSIDTFTAYKRYIASKPWVKTNYLRKPERKPDWI